MLSACSLMTFRKQAQRAAATQAQKVPTPAPAASPAPVPDGDFGLLRTRRGGLAPSPRQSVLRLLVLLLHRSWSRHLVRQPLACRRLGATWGYLVLTTRGYLGSTTRGYLGSFPLSAVMSEAAVSPPTLSFVWTRLVRLEGTGGVLVGHVHV